MQFNTITSPHIQAGSATAAVMRRVLYALIPGIITCVVLFGWGVIFNILIASVTAIVAESLILWLRQRPIFPTLQDGSALVTACLLAVAIPPLSPWWLTVVGVGFAIIIAKHLYGGLGYNPFNPAMVGYVVLLISFPLEMTSWLPPETLSSSSLTPLATANAIFLNQFPTSLSLDALTMATPLDNLRTQLDQVHSINNFTAETQHAIFGHFGGEGWEWTNLAFLLGGLWMVYMRVLDWRIPIALLGSLFSIALIFHLINPDQYAPPLFHLLSGAAMLGAFFIATDPVTASTTTRGRLIYGAGIGLITYIIRTWGGYPDGIAFAVLLMNMAAPTIDHYTQPRVFGQRKMGAK